MSSIIMSLADVRPRIDADAYVAPGAALIGDIELGAGANIWFGCVLRADGNVIRIGERSNIQDGTVIHVDAQPDGGRGMAGYATLIGNDVTVGHMAMLHGCTLQDRAFVGMKAIVMDGCVVETDGMLAAGALLTPGKRVKTGELWAGSPAKLMRPLKPDEIALIAWTADHYAERGRHYRLSAKRL